MRQKTTPSKCLTANHISLFLVRIHLMKKKWKCGRQQILLSIPRLPLLAFEAIFADGGSLINCSIICWILASIAFYGRKIMVGTCWTMIFCLKYASILCLKNSLNLWMWQAEKVSSSILSATVIGNMHIHKSVTLVIMFFII